MQQLRGVAGPHPELPGGSAGTAVAEPYFTTHLCPKCRQLVHGLKGRWTCTVCNTSNPWYEGDPLPVAED